MPVSVTGLSPVARQAPKLKGGPRRTIPVYGLVTHTTGSSLPTKALESGTDPLQAAIEYYLRPDSNWSQYVCGYGGELVQLSDEHVRASHVGFATERAAYLSGAWTAKLPRALVTRWRARWPQHKSPAHLFPGPSVNDAYAGLELVPIVKGCGAKPLSAGLKYTAAQHDAVAALARDMASRWRWPAGWWLTGRLCGHEDVNPITRHTGAGGWDPGQLRAKPWIDWDYIVDRIAG